MNLPPQQQVNQFTKVPFSNSVYMPCEFEILWLLPTHFGLISIPLIQTNLVEDCACG